MKKLSRLECHVYMSRDIAQRQKLSIQKYHRIICQLRKKMHRDYIAYLCNNQVYVVTNYTKYLKNVLK